MNNKYRTPMQDDYSLSSLVRNLDRIHPVRKSDLHPGDLVFVMTLNSTYRIEVLDGQMYRVSGGWFDKSGLSPQVTTIVGCTWGGSAVKVDIVAACGLCLEFANKVTTSTIQKIYVVPRHGAMQRLRVNEFDSWPTRTASWHEKNG